MPLSSTPAPHRPQVVTDESELDKKKDYIRAGCDPRHLIELTSGDNFIRKDGDAWERPEYAYSSHKTAWPAGLRYPLGTYVHPEPRNPT